MKKFDVVVIGGGFTGLAAANEIVKAGKSVCIVEADNRIGGLASTFNFTDDCEVEKFYHHWFNSDTHIQNLIAELGLQHRIVTAPSNTGMFFNGGIWRLTSPLDLLRFNAISFFDRVRLGLVTLIVRRLTDWKKIEHLSIREWLEPLCGKNTYSVVWEPLIRAKFSIHAEQVSAVWMWKKLVLRGSTRGKAGKEELLYFKGGFGSLAESIANRIKQKRGTIRLNFKVSDVEIRNRRLTKITNGYEQISGDKFLFTTPLPITNEILSKVAPSEWLTRIGKISYLGNICLVLRLKESLSKTYWLNVNDPGFPFVGVIEHTNFDDPSNYMGTHIVYLSRYIAITDPDWALDDTKYFEMALSHLRRMFPKFNNELVLEYNIWRSEHAQPVAIKNYSQLIPDQQTPIENTYISTMAQIYPEDRGTNYAVREGEYVAKKYLVN